MSVDEIIDEAVKFKAEHVVLTGGEPMISPKIHELASRFRGHGYHITIETAGTIHPNKIECDLVSLSPKLNNSTPEKGSIDPAWIKRHEETRTKSTQVLREWINSSKDYQFKFVISTRQDFNQVVQMMKESFSDVPCWKIQVMPEGTDIPTIVNRRNMLVDFCKESGYRLSDRLHIHLFGNTRGT